LVRRSEASCSVTNGGPRRRFFRRYRRDSGISVAAGPGSGTVARAEAGFVRASGSSEGDEADAVGVATATQ
jgi:hypothetical protein